MLSVYVGPQSVEIFVLRPGSLAQTKRVEVELAKEVLRTLFLLASLRD